MALRVRVAFSPGTERRILSRCDGTPFVMRQLGTLTALARAVRIAAHFAA